MTARASEYSAHGNYISMAMLQKVAAMPSFACLINDEDAKRNRKIRVLSNVFFLRMKSGRIA
jgi:hypothetical protein